MPILICEAFWPWLSHTCYTRSATHTHTRTWNPDAATCMLILTLVVYPAFNTHTYTPRSYTHTHTRTLNLDVVTSMLIFDLPGVSVYFDLHTHILPEIIIITTVHTHSSHSELDAADVHMLILTFCVSGLSRSRPHEMRLLVRRDTRSSSSPRCTRPVQIGLMMPRARGYTRKPTVQCECVCVHACVCAHVCVSRVCMCAVTYACVCGVRCRDWPAACVHAALIASRTKTSDRQDHELPHCPRLVHSNLLTK
jgi:hypothetical protein